MVEARALDFVSGNMLSGFKCVQFPWKRLSFAGFCCQSWIRWHEHSPEQTVFLQLHGSQSLISGAAVRRRREKVHESVAKWCTMYINDTKSCELWVPFDTSWCTSSCSLIFSIGRTVRLLAVVPDAELPGLVHLGKEIWIYIHIYPARKCACVITIYRNHNIFSVAP